MPPTSRLPHPKKILTAAGIFLVPAVIIVVVIASLTHRKPNLPAKPTAGSAFNRALPSPNLPKGGQNKLEIYMKAQQDSLKARQERGRDPYTQPGTNLGNPAGTGLPLTEGGSARPAPSLVTTPDINEQKVNERLQKIYAALGQSSASAPPAGGASATASPAWFPASPQTERLERMVAALQARDTTTSPQLQQVNQALDKILAIQHPAVSGVRADTTGSKPAPVSTRPAAGPENFPDHPPVAETNGFFEEGADADSPSTSAAPMLAIVHSTQTIVSGAIVRLRLLQDIYVGSQRIPASTFIYGFAAISGERITIQLTNISWGEKIFPVALKVYDAADGLEGLFVPGLISRDVIKENMSQGVSGLTLGTLDPSLGAQAASAGIETARNLLSRKIRLVKATLKEGHLVILRSTVQNH